jgi:hypothetical protein
MDRQQRSPMSAARVSRHELTLERNCDHCRKIKRPSVSARSSRWWRRACRLRLAARRQTRSFVPRRALEQNRIVRRFSSDISGRVGRPAIVRRIRNTPRI